jgi:epoxyqueuosine reductase
MLNSKIEEFLTSQGADFVHFVDVSHLIPEQNQGYSSAVLFGIYLSPKYLAEVTNIEDYVKQMVKNNTISTDEFHLIENKTDEMADLLAEFITQEGFTAMSQSEKNIFSAGLYKQEAKRTPLPHKAIAGLAGLGWIGKNNLLVARYYGCAISMCSVLTNAPLATVRKDFTASLCKECNVCKEICKDSALKGNAWNSQNSRDELIDVFACTTCLECMVFCPFTQEYIKRYIS